MNLNKFIGLCLLLPFTVHAQETTLHITGNLFLTKEVDYPETTLYVKGNLTIEEENALIQQNGITTITGDFINNVTNGTVFGTNQTAVYPVGGLNIIPAGAGNDKNVANYISSYNPDIIIIQYNWIAGAYGSSNLQALVDFINNDGGLILCSDGGALNRGRNLRCEAIIQTIFNNTNIKHTGTEDDNTQVLSSDNFTIANNTNPYNYPMKLDSNNNPTINTYSSPYTYNAHLFCNIMAWAIDYIQGNKTQ